MNSMQGDMPTLETVRALIAARRLDEAETSAETFVANHPNDAEGRFIVGSVQAERRNFAAALGNIQRSLAADRDPPWTRLLALANVLRDSGDAHGAESVARRLVLREPARVQAQNALGLALHDQARFDEAIAVFRQAAMMEPAYVGAQLNLALA